MKIILSACIALASAVALNAHAQAPDAGLPMKGSVKLLDAIKYVRTGERLLGRGRIVGGKDTTIQENPWQVALISAEAPAAQPAKGFFCGGSIYSARWIVTAAHCVDSGTEAAQVNILHSSADLNSGAQRVNVDRILYHPNYGKPEFIAHDYDVAVLRVTSNLPASAIALMSREEESAFIKPKTPLTVTGWGAIREGGDISTKLKLVAVPFVPMDICTQKLVYYKQVNERMLCAGSLAQQVGDSCQGDSGGPLTAVVNGKRVLAGIVSWGDGCNRVNRPGVYSRVALLSDWVRANAQ